MTVELIAAVLPGWEALRGGALNASGARCVDLQIVIIVIYTLLDASGAGRAGGGAARNLDIFCCGHGRMTAGGTVWRVALGRSADGGGWRGGHAFCMMEKP